jgi:Zn-dependent peptidase ImmA (M78 family)
VKVTRLDLDGTGSPLGLVGKILKAEPDLKIPVPIEELAIALDIGEIAELNADGFIGGLLTDPERSFGGILVKKGLHRHRRRFTIGHELGHFLIPVHKPAKAGQFLCSASDMACWSAREQDRAARMEVEANEFAAGILLPAPSLRSFLKPYSDPDLRQMLAVHEHFDVSREAASVIVTERKIYRIYKALGLPKLSVEKGENVPASSVYSSFRGEPGSVSDLKRADAGQWLESEWGKRLPALYEQVLAQSNGFSTIMLWCEDFELDEDYDPDADKTAKDRFRERQARFYGRR